MPYTPNDPNEIGFLYAKTNDRGTWFSGKINGESVVVFANRKTKDTQPDYRVLKAQKKEDRPAPASAPPADPDIPF
jgi:hypothetical protein